MSQGAGEGYYEARRERLVRGFDRVAGRIHRVLVRDYDEAFADSVLADARVEFERTIPDIPYIGGKRNLFSVVMIANGWIAALYRAMKARGCSAEEVARVGAEVGDQFFRSFPPWMLKLVGWLAFTRPARWLLRKQAERSQARRYAADFVYTLREGDGDDLALVFEECAVNKFYDAHALEELKPYCNQFDVIYSRLMGMGLDARETIGLGCQTCRLRFKHGRDTVIPPRLEGVLPER
jgi:hypothetical protein